MPEGLLAAIVGSRTNIPLLTTKLHFWSYSEETEMTLINRQTTRRGRTVRCARAVRKVGCFPPPVATDPKVLNSAPYTPLLVHQGFFFFSLMLAMGPRVLNSAPHAVLN